MATDTHQADFVICVDTNVDDTHVQNLSRTTSLVT